MKKQIPSNRVQSFVAKCSRLFLSTRSSFKGNEIGTKNGTNSVLTLAAVATFVVTGTSANASLFLADSIIRNAGSAFYSEQNIIATAGMALGGDGLTADDVFTVNASAGNSFVTDGFGTDYFGDGSGTPPVFTMTFNSAVNISEVVLWSYPNTGGAANGASAGTIEFDTGSGFGAPIPLTIGIGYVGVNPTGSWQPGTVNSVSPQLGVVRVRLTLTDNYYGVYSGIGGGNRVGLGTVAFGFVPVPATRHQAGSERRPIRLRMDQPSGQGV